MTSVRPLKASDCHRLPLVATSQVPGSYNPSPSPPRMQELTTVPFPRRYLTRWSHGGRPSGRPRAHRGVVPHEATGPLGHHVVDMCFSMCLTALSPAGQRDPARRRIHARMDRAGHEKVTKNDKEHDRHKHRLHKQRTTLPHNSPQVPVLPYTVPCDNCMQHGMLVCRQGRSYNMYVHIMPRDSPSRLRRKPCSRTMRGMPLRHKVDRTDQRSRRIGQC